MSLSALITQRRLARVGGFASVQVAVQVVAFAAGIALVRYLDQAEYGYYTLAISMVGLANVLLDLGLSTAVLATGGSLHKDPQRLGAVAADAFGLLRRLLIFGSLILLPVFAVMFYKQGLDPLHVAALSVLVLACTAFNVHSAIMLSVVRLRGDLSVQQRLDVGINLGKLLLVLAAGALFLDATVAVLVNLLAAAATFALLQRHLTNRIGGVPCRTQEHDPALLAFVRRQAPNSIYYCLMGQIAIWLVGILGTAERVAEVGALGRLAAVFTVLSAVMAALVQPYFARATTRREIGSGFIALNLGFAALSGALIGLAIVTPGALLWILGQRYAGLTAELPWMVLATCLAAWAGALYAAGSARGWLVPFWLVIPLGVSTMMLSAWAVDVSTVKGCFMMNSAVALSGLLATFGMLMKQLMTGVARIEGGT